MCVLEKSDSRSVSVFFSLLCKNIVLYRRLKIQKVMDNGNATKINCADEKVSKYTSFYIKQLESLNLKRALRWQSIRRSNLIFASGLTAGVFSIYFYTIKTVKQESFFDDFDVPETITD